MPLYIFKNDETGETKEVIQRMNEEHVFFDENGVEWRRLFTVPQASIDTSIDPFSSKAFSEKTGGSGGTIGDLWDRSRELSEKRESIIGEGSGKDPVKNKYLDNWSKKRGGRKHIEDKRKG